MAEPSKTLRPGIIIGEVMQTVESRKKTMPENSYVASLLRGGTDAILCKMAEELGEVVKAAREKGRAEQVRELCDLLFHVMVLMARQEITLKAVEAELARRHGISGLEEKAGRKSKPPRVPPKRSVQRSRAHPVTGSRV